MRHGPVTSTAPAAVAICVIGAVFGCSAPRVPDVPFACASSFDCTAPLVCASDGQCRPRGEVVVPVDGTVTFSPAAGVVGSIVHLISPRAGAASAVHIGETTAVILRRAPGSADVLVMPSTKTGVITVESDDGRDVSVDAFGVSVAEVPRVAGPASRVAGLGSVGQSLALDAVGVTALVGELAGDAGATAWPFTLATGTFADLALDWQPMNGATSVALSADGTVALVGNGAANSNIGRAFVFERDDAGRWERREPSLVPSDATGGARFGTSVALSADGTTAAIGGPDDTSGRGAVWLFARGDGGWVQTTAKVRVQVDGDTSTGQGNAVALDATGDTLVLGASNAGNTRGAAWVLTRRDTTWAAASRTFTVPSPLGAARLGSSVDISGDGTTVVLGGPGDTQGAGAAWVYTRQTDGGWPAEGEKLTSGTGRFGTSVALSLDGHTALVGNPRYNSNAGRAWLYVRNDAGWQQQPELFGLDAVGPAAQGTSVALSLDGRTALVGGPLDTGGRGAVWVYRP